MLADIAIIDPALTVSVPPMVTAATGVDAMAHCVEAFTSKRSHPIIDAYALQGIELVGRYLAPRRRGRRRHRGPRRPRARRLLRRRLPRPGQHHRRPRARLSARHPPQARARHRQRADLPARARGQRPGGAGEDRAGRPRARLRRRGAAAGARRRDATSAGASASTWRSARHGVPRDDLPASAKEAHAIRRLLDWNPVDLSEADILEIYEAAY